MNTGIEIIDTQHKMIEEACEELKDILINRDKSSYNPNVILEKLISYYEQHFKTEDSLLSSIPDRKAAKVHKREHAAFLSNLKSLSEKNIVTVSLILDLQNWNKNHVKYMDMRDFAMAAV